MESIRQLKVEVDRMKGWNNSLHEAVRRTSVARFGKILPLWPNAKSLWLLFEVFVCIWQNFEPILEFFNAIGQVYIAVNGQIV